MYSNGTKKAAWLVYSCMQPWTCFNRTRMKPSLPVRDLLYRYSALERIKTFKQLPTSLRLSASHVENKGGKSSCLRGGLTKIENPELLKLKGHGSREITTRSICISAYTMPADHADIETASQRWSRLVWLHHFIYTVRSIHMKALWTGIQETWM